MSITYTRTTQGSTTDLAAAVAAGGSLVASTQYWFVIVPLNAQYYQTITTCAGVPTNIATATTDTTNKTINLTWTAPAGALGYLIYWTKTDPAGNAENFNLSGRQVHSSTNVYDASTTTNSFSLSTEATTGTPTYSMPYTDSYRFVMIFNTPTDSIAMSSVTEEVTMEKIYQACVANSWNSVTKFDDNSYNVSACLNLPGASVTLNLKNTNIVTKGTISNAASGSMTLAGYDADTTSSEGSSITNIVGQGVCWGSYFNLRNCKLHGLRLLGLRKGYRSSIPEKYLTPAIAGNDFLISNASIDFAQYLQLAGGALSTSYIKNSVVSSSRYGFNFGSDTSLATFSGNRSINCFQSVYLRYSPTVNGLEAFGTYGGTGEAIAINSVAEQETKATIIDSNFNWLAARIIYWYNNGRTPSGNEYVKNVYTQTFHITDESNTNLSGATITITDAYGTLKDTLTTDANGLVTTLTEAGVSKSTASTANNYGIYTNYNPFTIVISKAGYETVTLPFSIDKKTELTIALKSQITKLEDDNGNVFDRVDKTNSGTTNLRRKIVKV
jgi:hypothetical protein